MTDTLEKIEGIFGVNINQKQQPVEIPNTDRNILANLFRSLQFKLGAEIGVERGIYSQIIAESNPGLKLYAIDAWEAYQGYRDHTTQQKLDGIFSEAQDRLSLYPNVEMIREFSMEAVDDFEDESLDFVYIDANHEFQNVVNDICEWQTKVKVGGIIAGHDYIKRKDNGYLMHVPMAVHGYVEAYNIKPLFVLGTKEKVEGQLRDDVRSWFYVKPEKTSVKPGWTPPTP